MNALSYRFLPPDRGAQLIKPSQETAATSLREFCQNSLLFDKKLSQQQGRKIILFKAFFHCNFKSYYKKNKGSVRNVLFQYSPLIVPAGLASWPAIRRIHTFARDGTLEQDRHLHMQIGYCHQNRPHLPENECKTPAYLFHSWLIQARDL